MAEPLTFSARAFLAVPREALWEFLSDTDRLNRTIDLPAVRFVPLTDPSKKGHYDAETRKMGVRLIQEVK